MTSSFNAFGQTRKVYDAGATPIWLGTVTPVPMGGTLASEFVKSRALYPAGTPINLTNKVITPVFGWTVKAYETGSTNDTIVIAPVVCGGVNFIPAVGEAIMKLESFDTKGKAIAVAAVSETAEGVKVEIAHQSAAFVAAGDALVIAEAAGSSKGAKVVPNHYLYNDIFLGDIDPSLEGAGASGSGVRFHAEGILIDRTPGADFAEALAKAIPGVLQVHA